MRNLIALLMLCSSVCIKGQDTILLLNKPFPYMELLQPALDTFSDRASTDKKHPPLILDFFSSSCVVCFKSLPKLKELQEIYNGRLLFVLIGKEDTVIRKIYNRFRDKLALGFPVIYDSVMHSKLQLDSYPKYIWIDENNITQAVVGVDELTGDNIEKFLSQISIAQETKINDKVYFDPRRLFLLNGNGGFDSSFLLRSVLTRWQKGNPLYLPPSIYSSENPWKFQVLGASLNELYNYAFHGYGRWDTESKLYDSIYHKIIIGSLDSLPQVWNGKKARYNYSVQVADSNFHYSDLQQVLQNDLENYFGFRARVIRKQMPCWYLRAIKRKRTILKTKGEKRSINTTQTSIDLINVPVSSLIELLYRRNQNAPPFIDETEIDYNIDLSLKAVVFDLAELQEALKRKGLILAPGVKEMRAILLTPKRNNVAAH